MNSEPLAPTSTQAAFAERAEDLAEWTELHLVNRHDVWGGYLPTSVRRPGGEKTVTKPAKDNRGKKQLTKQNIRAHFIGADHGDIIGLHAIAPENTCRWFGIEVDAHGDRLPENWSGASKIIGRLETVGLSPLVTDSNGNGGYHILVLLDAPIASDVVYRFAQSMIENWEAMGLSEKPETFPKQSRLYSSKPYGNWLRLPGRHHTRPHWSKVWGGDGWYEGNEAVDLILNCPVNRASLVATLAPPEEKKPAPNTIIHNRHIDDAEKVKRARAYINKMPSAVAGQRGHDATFAVACELYRFGLSDADPSALFSDFNRRCQPEWSDTELRHKLDDARASVESAGEVGIRLREDRNTNGRRGAIRTSNRQTDHLKDDMPLAHEDIGNADKFIEMHRDYLRWVAAWGAWLVWDGKRLVCDETMKALGAAKETALRIYQDAANVNEQDRKAAMMHAMKAQRRPQIVAMMELAKPSLAITTRDLDRDPMILNCQNATVNLTTFEAHKHDRADGCTKVCNARYDPTATAPTWIKFLKRILSDQLIDWLQKALGYSMTGATTEQVLFLMIGAGANGKTTLADTVAYVLGDYAGKADRELLNAFDGATHPTGVADLQGRRFVVCAEGNEGRRLDEAKLKDLTGETLIKARKLYQDFSEFIASHKLWLYSNHRPVVRGQDHGLWRRLKLIPFNETIADDERDPELSQKLRGEADGILAWMIQGCRRWQSEGLGTPAEVTAATAAYRNDMDSIGAWLADSCTFGPRLQASARDLYQSYKMWCDDAGEHAVSQKRLAGQLQERGLQNDRDSYTNRKIWRGLGVNRSETASDYGQGI